MKYDLSNPSRLSISFYKEKYGNQNFATLQESKPNIEVDQQTLSNNKTLTPLTSKINFQKKNEIDRNNFIISK